MEYGIYDAVASETHFLVKLVSAAPCSFCAAAWSLQHFLAKLVRAAPCRLLPVACPLQLSSANAAVTKQNDTNTNAIVLIFVSLFRALQKQPSAGTAVTSIAACRSGSLCRRCRADIAPAV